MVSDSHLIMFHGTTDAFLRDILEEGLVPSPPRRGSHVAKDGSVNHLMSSLDGVYMASQREASAWYASSSAGKFGGEPLMFVLRVPVDRLVPDEDEINCMLNWPICQALGYDDKFEDGLPPFDELTPWSLSIAETAAATLLRLPPDHEIAKLMGAHIHAMVLPALGASWNRDPAYFLPEEQAGWNCPNWLVELDRTEGGRALYRKHMDVICSLMRGMHPYDYPCGLDSCRGRVVDPIFIEGPPNDVAIIGFGPPDEPFALYSRDELVDGSEIHVSDPVLDRFSAVRRFG